MKKVKRFQRRVLLRKSFDAIAVNAEEASVEREKEVKATIHHNRTIASKCFQSLIAAHDIAVKIENMKRTAATFVLASAIRLAFRRWRLALETVRHGKILAEFVLVNESRRLAIKVLRAWQNYVQVKVAFQFAIEEFLMRVIRAKYRRIMQVWGDKTHTSARLRQEKKAIEEEHKLGLLRKERITCAEKSLNEGRLRRFLKYWVIYRDMKISKRLNDVTARLHRQIHLQKRPAIRLRKAIQDSGLSANTLTSGTEKIPTGIKCTCDVK
ncbi:hypothetical protein HDU83_001507 [Entophlyctis luteolus]|nr:hypothetical protein HDU83_001507 [Entophlyctis luteolus]